LIRSRIEGCAPVVPGACALWGELVCPAQTVTPAANAAAAIVMNLHHFNGKAMPDVSTLHATLFAPQAVYIREMTLRTLSGATCASTLIPNPPGFGLVARQSSNSDWLYLDLAY
jgi:hypothetical protein